MSLVVDSLSCVRGGRLVFANASFSAHAGAFLALRGPNGSGKSTLLRGLAGLLAVDGDARWGAASMRDDRDAYQEQIAYAGHLDAVKPALSVEENVRFWARLNGAAAAAGHAALERFRLDRIATLPAGYCSAGQKRRLGLARLCVIDRPLWLLDEPTVSLDRESVAEFAAVVRAHCAGGGVAIAATHIDLGLPDAAEILMDDFQPTAQAAAGTAERVDDPFLDPAFETRASVAKARDA